MSDWPAELAKKRKEYDAVRDKHVLDPMKIHEKELDLDVHNPLSTSEDVCLGEYFPFLC